MGDQVIFLVDMESFYASVEKARDPNLEAKPVIVAGDPNRRSGVVLAACPLAKKKGVKNANRLWEALQKCPEAVVVPPRMQDYIEASIKITEILEQYTDLVEPFSIDEQFMDVTHSQRLFGDPFTIASSIQKEIRTALQVRARVGIGENKVLAKMACDNFAKKNPSGVFHLKREELANTLWLLPIEKMFGIGSKMAAHLRNMGIRTIGQLAGVPVERLKKRWGINGHVLWMTANGHDASPVTVHSHSKQKMIGHGMTLPRDYTGREEIKVVLLELCEEVCSRARRSEVMGETVSLSVSGARYHSSTGFHHQLSIPATNITMELFTFACQLLHTFWDGYPIRRLSVSLSKLTSDHHLQLSLLQQQREKLFKLGKTMDQIKDRYGTTAVMRASSLLPAAQAQERSLKIGGHYK